MIVISHQVNFLSRIILVEWLHTFMCVFNCFTYAIYVEELLINYEIVSVQHHLHGLSQKG